MFHSNNCDVEAFIVMVFLFCCCCCSDYIFLGLCDSETQTAKFKIPRPALLFASIKLRDTSLQSQDFEACLKFAKTWHPPPPPVHHSLAQSTFAQIKLTDCYNLPIIKCLTLEYNTMILTTLIIQIPPTNY